MFWKPGGERPAGGVGSAPVDREDGDAPLLFAPSGPRNSRNLAEQRAQLPVAASRDALLYLIERHGVTVVTAATGSGKSTQIPQYLLEAGFANEDYQIACTQPRRVAVQSVAARVAEERGTQLGQQVGYRVRFEDVTTPGTTRLVYMTDGVLVRELLSDPLLSHYSVIVLDETHERSVGTDMLLGLLKKVQRRRPQLRLVLSSATLQARALADFFQPTPQQVRQAQAPGAPEREAALVSVEGQLHPVRVHYLEEPCRDYLQQAVATALEIHATQRPGDVLVFLTGQEEVDTAVQLLQEEGAARPGAGGLGLLPLPLYGSLSPADQQRVFESPPRGKRKVIVATNVAETSVTVEGVVYVVDCGFTKQRFYNPLTGVDALLVVPISRASAVQRAGRAGRVRPGQAFRLYTEAFFRQSLAAHPVPELQRSDLAPVVLQLKALGIDNLMRFDFPAPPPPEAMLRSLELLYALGFLDSDARLTHPAGKQAAELPLEPLVSKLVLAGAEAGCGEEAVTVAAMMQVEFVWVSSRGRQREVDEARSHFAVAEGDHLTFLNIFQAFQQSRRSSQWCAAHCLNYRALLHAASIRDQLRAIARRLAIPLSSSDRDSLPLLRAITAAFFPHAAQLLPGGDGSTYRTLHTGQQVKIHPGSALFRSAPPWVVYRTLSQNEDRLYMQDVAPTTQERLLEVAPHFFTKRKPALSHG